MENNSELWLAGLQALIVVTFLVAVVWRERKYPSRDLTPSSAVAATSPSAEAVALEALLAMRGLVHQLANNIHELALQFDLALSMKDEQKIQEVRSELRTRLHKFTEITHEVARLDARLAGVQPSRKPPAAD